MKKLLRHCFTCLVYIGKLFDFKFIRKVKVNGKEIFLDFSLFESVKMFAGYYEKRETDVLLKFLKYFKYENLTGLNVGANMGYYTHLLSQYSNQVFAFEPQERMCSLIRKSDNLSNIKLYQAAANDQNVRVSINIANGSPLLGYVCNTPEGEIDSFPVDELRLLKLDIVIIDVEGFEVAVLRGMIGTIGKYQPRLFMIEICDDYLKRNGHSFSDVMSFMEGWGYVSYSIFGRSLKKNNQQRAYNDSYFFVKHDEIETYFRDLPMLFN